MKLQKLAEKYQKDNGRIYVYFDDEKNFEKAINLLPEQGISSQIMGYGALETTSLAVKSLLSAGFKFELAENMKEIYNNKELINYWDKLVEKEFGN